MADNAQGFLERGSIKIQQPIGLYEPKHRLTRPCRRAVLRLRCDAIGKNDPNGPWIGLEQPFSKFSVLIPADACTNSTTVRLTRAQRLY